MFTAIVGSTISERLQPLRSRSTPALFTKASSFVPAAVTVAAAAMTDATSVTSNRNGCIVWSFAAAVTATAAAAAAAPIHCSVFEWFVIVGV